MKITIDTIKKELVIAEAINVPELIEFLKDYSDYTIISNIVLLNGITTTPYNPYPFVPYTFGPPNIDTSPFITCNNDLGKIYN
jgi:hypothetical protein